MTNEQAKFMADYWLEILESEAKVTRKVIAAIPADKGGYAPDGRSMNALTLAYHIAASEVWFLDAISKGTYEWTGEDMPAEIKTSADVLAWYDARLPAVVIKVRNTPPETLANEVTVFGPPRANVVYLDFCLRHSIHHRGQLAAYLRPMGSKVPSIYGGSADEPMQASA